MSEDAPTVRLLRATDGIHWRNIARKGSEGEGKRFGVTTNKIHNVVPSPRREFCNWPDEGPEVTDPRRAGSLRYLGVDRETKHFRISCENRSRMWYYVHAIPGFREQYSQAGKNSHAQLIRCFGLPCVLVKIPIENGYRPVSNAIRV